MLLPELRAALERLRRWRGFDVERYVRAKVVLLNAYMRNARLDSCVIGVSGGVDSAVVLGLAARAKSQPDSPIKKIVAVMMPIFDPGATNQSAATERGQEAARAFGVDPVVIDISPGHHALKTAVDGALKTTGEDWASGQLVSYARTPALYYITSLLTQQGHAGILLGTTNRDEGGYLGFIGKASDAMVDVQAISDLHKSEVYAVAAALGVPAAVLNAMPTGDMCDARPDEEVFGAPYDFVELYLLYKDLIGDGERNAVQRGWSAEAREQFDFCAHNLEELHRYNWHKYLGRSPAVHLDVLPASTPGGWNNSLYLQFADPPVDTTYVNGLFRLDSGFVAALNVTLDPEIVREPILGQGDSAMILRYVLRRDEIERLRAELQRCEWIPVGIDGMRKHFNPATARLGSWRATAYDPVFARTLWNRIGGHIGTPRIMDASTPTDWDGTPVWRAVGINPMLRFIRYTQGGALIPHYDAPFSYHEGKRTLVSLILTINPGDGSGGATRFIRDPQSHLPVVERDLADWTRFAAPEEVLLAVQPEAGMCLAFDHRLLHDGEAVAGTAEKIILRTDVVFERCGTAPSHV
jgi:NAD+ synthase (glutamine-hydrolysing)